MSEKNIAFQVISGLAKSDQCIDDERARQIAKHIFGIEDSALEKAKICKTSTFVNKMDFGWGYSIPLLTYMVRDGTYLYRIRIGYGPRRNVICYSEKITMTEI